MINLNKTKAAAFILSLLLISATVGAVPAKNSKPPSSPSGQTQKR